MTRLVPPCIRVLSAVFAMPIRRLIRPSIRLLITTTFTPLLFLSPLHLLAAQAPAPYPSSAGSTATVQDETQHKSSAALAQRLETVSAALTLTQQNLRQSMQEVDRLAEELRTLRTELAGRTGAPPPAASAIIEPPIASSTSTLSRVQEEQEAMAAEIQQHDQTKVESVSKYPVRIDGLLLFNAFSNVGVVDNIDLPTLSLDRLPGESHGSAGATMRQTILGVHANGPKIAGARSSASVSVDFFGDLAYSSYSSPTGSVRLRYAQIALDWERTTLQGGIQEPLISPLSPTSYATVAQPALSWAGNLWTWSPQLRMEQRIPLHRSVLHLEGGLLDALPTGGAASRVSRIVSPGEQARRPAFEGRASLHSSEGEHAVVIGLGAYTGKQVYPGANNVHSWAATADWLVPLGHRLEFSGEAFRGRALGGLGGGAYKNVLTGLDSRTGLSRTNGVDSAGGWSQLKWLVIPSVEANVSFGLDDAFASNFRRLKLTPSSAFLQFYTRNSMIIGNLVFRPKTYLILSPEIRKIRTWQNTDGPYNATIFTFSAAYRF